MNESKPHGYLRAELVTPEEAEKRRETAKARGCKVFRATLFDVSLLVFLGGYTMRRMGRMGRSKAK